MRFKYFLALKLGRFVVEIDQLPSSEITYWMAYFNLSLSDKDEVDATTKQTLIKLDALSHADRS